ncbi:hypothetical protein B0G81_8616 [Paraburkholderia sp. BL6665CI2N2]|nr:hypothetical protein B0G81_8616 [Paraburkholderia sp. BL6665CI2N2]
MDDTSGETAVPTGARRRDNEVTRAIKQVDEALYNTKATG